MKIARLPDNEKERLEKLFTYEILDTPPEIVFDDIVKLASQICGTPISLITLLDNSRQWFKANKGLNTSQTPKDWAFCSHTILEDEFFIVENALENTDFADNPLVTDDPHIRFYAGVPLSTPDGFRLGSLCVIDTKPNQVTEEQLFALKTLAKQVMTELELRLKVKEAKQTTQQLLSKNEFLKKLFSVISHDFRSPLISMQQFLELFRDEEMALEDYRMLAESVENKLSSTKDLVENLLIWASKKVENKVVRLQEVYLYLSVQNIFDTLQEKAKEKNVQLINQIEEEQLLVIDEEMLLFVLRNLIDNALKYTENGKVLVKNTTVNNFIQIKVEDTGKGIVEEKQPYILGNDRRYLSTGTRGEKGSGVALMLCKSFLEDIGGEITFESELGKGTTFTITLPTLKA